MFKNIHLGHFLTWDELSEFFPYFFQIIGRILFSFFNFSVSPGASLNVDGPSEIFSSDQPTNSILSDSTATGFLLISSFLCSFWDFSIRGQTLCRLLTRNFMTFHGSSFCGWQQCSASNKWKRCSVLQFSALALLSLSIYKRVNNTTSVLSSKWIEETMRNKVSQFFSPT